MEKGNVICPNYFLCCNFARAGLDDYHQRNHIILHKGDKQISVLSMECSVAHPPTEIY